MTNERGGDCGHSLGLKSLLSAPLQSRGLSWAPSVRGELPSHWTPYSSSEAENSSQFQRQIPGQPWWPLSVPRSLADPRARFHHHVQRALGWEEFVRDVC